MGMKWFRFYIDFWLVIGCVGSSLMALSAILSFNTGDIGLYNLSFSLIYQMIRIILFVLTCVYMKKRNISVKMKRPVILSDNNLKAAIL